MSTLNLGKSKLIRVLLSISIFLSLLFAIPMSASAAGDSSWSQQTVNTEALTDVVFGNNIFVAMGKAGTIVTSPDGNSWVQQTSNTIQSLSAIVYGGNLFVAVGTNGTIVTSADGNSWTQQSSNSTEYLTGIAYGNNKFVAVGFNNTILTSPNGITWAAQSSHTSEHLLGIAYGNNTFVVSTKTIKYDNFDFKLLISNDGTAWSSIKVSNLFNLNTTGETNISAVKNINNIFTVHGYSMLTNGEDAFILTSGNGITWSKNNDTSGVYSVAYGDNIFLGVGGESIKISADCTSWASHAYGDTVPNNSAEGSRSLISIAFGNDTFVAVGDNYYDINGIIHTEGLIMTLVMPRPAVQTTSSILVDGKTVPFQAYAINGNNYFKLRDLAMAFNGTGKQFNVGWDGSNNAISITSNTQYIPAGGELTQSGDSSGVSAALSSAKVYLDGKEVSLTAYTINGNNYFKLRDVGQALNFGVTWNGSTNMIKIDTSAGYSA